MTCTVVMVWLVLKVSLSGELQTEGTGNIGIDDVDDVS